MTAAPFEGLAGLADRYRVERELGRSGMATVYLARDLKHNRQVAIKVLADALAYAHARSIIHRDIKPESILLQRGHALVADFGIALAVQHAGGQRMTQTGLSLGTPQYMSPEQAMGERSIDARSDIYALGAVLYEMLTGEPPFTGPTMQAIVARLLSETPRSRARATRGRGASPRHSRPTSCSRRTDNGLLLPAKRIFGRSASTEARGLSSRNPRFWVAT